MAAAGIPAGPRRTPKSLRHGSGVHAISWGVPLNMLSRWMGHATFETTAIHANALGAEEQASPLGCGPERPESKPLSGHSRPKKRENAQRNGSWNLGSEDDAHQENSA